MNRPDYGVANAFPEVESAAPVDQVASYLEAQASNAFWAGLKSDSISALAIRPGSAVLDVGCGLGDDAHSMSRRAGPGLAVGVDKSPSLLGVARRRQPPDSRVLLTAADAGRLPFASDSFRAVRVERTLQHVDDPQTVLHELVRVLAPGGSLVAIEPDWDTLIVDADPIEITREVCRWWGRGIRHPNVGRKLLALLGAAGVQVMALEPRTAVIRDLEFAEQQFALFRIVQQAVNGGAFDQAGGNNWLADVRARGREGRFLYSVTYFMALAHKN